MNTILIIAFVLLVILLVVWCIAGAAWMLEASPRTRSQPISFLLAGPAAWLVGLMIMPFILVYRAIENLHERFNAH